MKHEAASQFDDGKVDEFVRRLTDLSRETGIGIAGTPELFIIEAEDNAFHYRCDEQSALVLA